MEPGNEPTLQFSLINDSQLYLPNSDRPFSIFQKVHETRKNLPKDWEYYDIDQMNAPDLYQGGLFFVLSHMMSTVQRMQQSRVIGG